MNHINLLKNYFAYFTFLWLLINNKGFFRLRTHESLFLRNLFLKVFVVLKKILIGPCAMLLIHFIFPIKYLGITRVFFLYKKIQ